MSESTAFQITPWVWWEKSGGYAVGPRDKGMAAWVATIEETQAICGAVREATLLPTVNLMGERMRAYAGPRHMFGMLIFCDDLLPDGTAEVRDASGRVLARIVNLGQ